MQIRFVVRGADKVQAFLREVPRGTVRIALRAITEYLIGDGRHGLKHYPPYRGVSRASAYGDASGDGAPPGYFSLRQFHYVMAHIKSGDITPGIENRTGAAAEAYGSCETNNGYGMTIYNQDRGAYYTQSDSGQANQPRLVGWRTVAQNVADNLAGAVRHARAAISIWLKERK